MSWGTILYWMMQHESPDAALESLARTSSHKNDTGGRNNSISASSSDEDCDVACHYTTFPALTKNFKMTE